MLNCDINIVGSILLDTESVEPKATANSYIVYIEYDDKAHKKYFKEWKDAKNFIHFLVSGEDDRNFIKLSRQYREFIEFFDVAIRLDGKEIEWTVLAIGEKLDVHQVQVEVTPKS